MRSALQLSLIHISIKKVSSKKELKTFIRFNYELYKENPYSVPDLYDDMLNTFSPKMCIRDSTNIVSADQVGKFPDSNIGDALKRISGINVQYDQGEARFGQVRGTSADLSSVTINGNRVPSAEGDTRNVQ